MSKSNGFSYPFHPYQILTWLLLLWHSILPLSLFFSKPRKSVLMLLFYPLFYLLISLITYFGFIVTHSNPGISVQKDPHYLQTEDSATYYCTVCRSYVEKTSKHCGQCDRCIHGFDHHCKWLNNCIGQANYKCFIYLLIVVLANETILIAFESILIKTLKDFRYWLILIDLILNAWIFLVLGYLIGFHVYLKITGMTTYEYLKRKNKVTNNSVMVKMQLEQSTREKVHAKSKSEDKKNLFERQNLFELKIGHSASKEDIFHNSISCSVAFDSGVYI